MSESNIPKDLITKIGRSFALIYNRAAMYNAEHPSTLEAMTELYKVLSISLQHSTPIVIILNKEEFYVDDEPFDPRLNTTRMLGHFKRAALESVSFSAGLHPDELNIFASVFVDLLKYPDADAMKDACEEQGIRNVKINHVFYKKVTADDEVIDRKELEEKQAAATGDQADTKIGQALESMVESVLSDELEQSLSIAGIMENPQEASEQLLNADLALAHSDGGEGDGGPGAGGEPGGPGGPGGAGGEGIGSGMLIARQLQNIREEVEAVSGDPQSGNLHELAEAVFEMKRNLLKGLEAQKATGVVFENEEQIRRESDELTDNVLIQLVTQEYQKGEISTQRLAQILRRLIPEPGEIQRLLPKIKEALLEEGMPLAEFLQLTVELKRELKSEELAHVLEESAEDFGVSGENLIEEIRRNPKGAAELIYLASEIRKGTGDESVMSDLLVDYIERVSSKITIDAAQKKGDEGGKQLRGIIASVENALLKGLKNKDVNAEVIHKVAQRLNDRMEQCIEKMESQMFTLQHQSFDGAGDEQSTTMLGEYEKKAEDPAQIKSILNKVKDTIHDDVEGITPEPPKEPEFKPLQKEEKKAPVHKPGELPEGIYDHKTIVAFLEKEIARSMRYDTPFSVLVLSVLRITPKIKMEIEDQFKQAVVRMLLQTIADTFRVSDVIGMLDKNKVLAMLPMTISQEAKLATRRIMKTIHEQEFFVDDIPLTIQLAGSATTFDQKRTPTLDKFVKRAESDSSEMVRRLKNIHNIF